MERMLKIAELAKYWGCSVPTTWNRVRKEGLQTLLKTDENNKEVNYVSISDDILAKYLNNANNNAVNNDNNEILQDVNDNNVSNSNNNSISASELFDKLTELNNGYNEHIKQLNEELLTLKSQVPLLEDKASREGYYLNEIKTLKDENEVIKKDKKRLITLLISIIMVLLITLSSVITYHSITGKKNEPAEHDIQNQTPQVQQIVQKKTK